MHEPETGPELVRAFEDGTLHTCSFSHTEHLYVVWALVRSHGTLGGLARFEHGIKTVTARAGTPEKYHATVTHALSIAVGERVAAAPDASWAEFVAANVDLATWPSPLLETLYGPDLLTDAAARSGFVLPVVNRQ